MIDEYGTRTVDAFQSCLNHYHANIVEVHQEQTEQDIMLGRSARITCKIEFHSVQRYKDFVVQTGQVHNMLRAERELHKRYPALQEAYEQYQTLVKLYGG